MHIDLFHMTTLNINSQAIPHILTYDKKLYVEVSGLPIDGPDGFDDYYSDIIPINTWISVQLRQQLENGKYQFIFLLDGKQIFKKENPTPQEFNNVKVYASSPWYSYAQEGSIRNLVVASSWS